MILGALIPRLGMHLDAIAALLAALVVLLAVFLAWQAARRDAQRQRQLDTEAALRERGRQKVNLARALLFEIDSFYRHYLDDIRAIVESPAAWEGQYPVVKWVPAQPFPVYAANAGRLGELDEETAEEVIYYYGSAAAYLALLRDYKTAMDRVLRKEALEISIPEARLHLGRIREALPDLLGFTQTLGRKLAEITGVPYQYLRMATAERGTPQPTAPRPATPRPPASASREEKSPLSMPFRAGK